MKHVVISALLAVFVIGCGVSDPKTSTMTVNPATAIKVSSLIPYKKGSVIAANIKNECSLDSQLSEFIHAYAVGEGIGVIRQNRVSSKAKGKTLIVQITDAISQGNAFIGHRKFTRIKGELYENGKRQAGFTAARLSGGGAWAGFKGSCSVLGRTVKALGSDVSLWLKHPADGAHLGDAI
ncbi:MAG: hypothetical protein OQK75_13840 [Gammaproteobacteria bacterium]|nr:hypothetical protein [Gammaproteobacteria bacterium]MCW8988742.1 hypothetical protein [Gammaproteobacteria bacterium]MCW9030643.1 hypothetical protein [Gammaproteobacteria bacterium]